MSETPGTPGRSGPRRPALPLLAVSLVSAAVAVVHVLAPDLKIDFITVGLLAVAALPWLAPVIKTLRFGDFQIELRDIKANLQDVRQQVSVSAEKVDALAEQVQQITFVGPIDSNQRQGLEEVLGDFYLHLRQLGVQVPTTPPQLRVVEPTPGSPVGKMYYDVKDNQIVVSRSLLADTSRIMRSYMTYLLTTTSPTPVREMSPQARVLLAGLAFYLPCSYRDDPVMGAESAEVYNAEQVRMGSVEPYRLDGANRFRIRKTPVEATDGKGFFHGGDADGLAWAGTFWRIRDLVGADTLDPVLVEAWLALEAPAGAPPFQRFVEGLVEGLARHEGPAIARQAQDVIARRGLAEARTWAGA